MPSPHWLIATCHRRSSLLNCHNSSRLLPTASATCSMPLKGELGPQQHVTYTQQQHLTVQLSAVGSSDRCCSVTMHTTRLSFVHPRRTSCHSARPLHSRP
jgi:hypothetical protein